MAGKAKHTKYTLNELLSGVSEETARHWKQGLAAGAIAFLPAVFLYGFALRKFFLGLATILTFDKSESFEAEQFREMAEAILPAYVLFVLAGILFYFGDRFTTLFNLRAVFSGAKPSWPDFLPRLLAGLRLLPQMLGQGVVLAAIEYFVAFWLAVLGMAVLAWYWFVLGAGSSERFGAFTVIVFGLLMACVFIFNFWLTTKAEFILPVLADEKKSGVFESLGKSFQIVKGRFWRVLGLSFLVRISLDFALSVSLGPILFFAMLPGYLELIKASTEHAKDIIPLIPRISLSFILGFCLSYYLNALGRSLIYPIFLGLFYRGLKSRRK